MTENNGWKEEKQAANLASNRRNDEIQRVFRQSRANKAAVRHENCENALCEREK